MLVLINLIVEEIFGIDQKRLIIPLREEKEEEEKEVLIVFKQRKP